MAIKYVGVSVTTRAVSARLHMKIDISKHKAKVKQLLEECFSKPLTDAELDEIYLIPLSVSETKQAKNSHWFELKYRETNRILSRYDDEQSVLLAVSLGLALCRIKELGLAVLDEKETIFSATDAIRQTISGLSEEFKLEEHSKAEVEKLIIAVDVSIGSKEFHTEELTFRLNHYRDLYAMVLYARVLSPLTSMFLYIFGDKNHYLRDHMLVKKRSDSLLSKKFKDYLALSLMYDRLELHWGGPTGTLEKLIFYIEHVINRFNKITSIDAAMNGGSMSEQLVTSVLGMLFFRDYAKFILNDPKPKISIISQTYTHINNHVMTLIKSKTPYKLRRDMDSDDDSNSSAQRSQLEVDSPTSTQTLDTVALAIFMFRRLKSSFSKITGIPQELLDATIVHNELADIPVPRHTMLLLTSVYSRYFGNGNFLEYLSRTQIMTIMSMTQAKMIKEGYYELAYMVSAKPSPGLYPTSYKDCPELTQEQKDNLDYIRQVYKEEESYHKLKSRLHSGQPIKERINRVIHQRKLTEAFDEITSGMVLSFLNEWHVVNIAQALRKHYKLERAQGSVFLPSKQLIKEYSLFLTEALDNPFN
jgi:hypothetical protein